MEIATPKKPETTPNMAAKYSYTVIFLLISLYIMMMVGKGLWEHFQINKQLNELKAEVEILREKNKKLENLNAYYNTDSFIEREVRQKLNYKKPDEKVILLPIPPQEIPEQKIETQLEEQPKSVEKPNYIRWYDYFFK